MHLPLIPGVCPISDELCIAPKPCRDVLSLMYSCGMYNYSGQFAFTVGLPAKSGVAGGLILVVPRVMGICLFSPRLDPYWNTVRGVEFARRLVRDFALHNYDAVSFEPKLDPTVDWSLQPKYRPLQVGARVWGMSRGCEFAILCMCSIICNVTSMCIRVRINS